MSEERNGMASQLSIGYRFYPTKEELVRFYLDPLVRGVLPPQPCVIPVIDVYNCQPTELPYIFHDESIIPPDDQRLTWWFFSPYAPDTAGKVKRSTRHGYWKKSGDEKEVTIKDKNYEVIGKKKILVFHQHEEDNDIRTNWVIHEYHLPDNVLNRTHVLCRLKLKRDKQKDNSSERSNLRAFMQSLFERKLHQRG